MRILQLLALALLGTVANAETFNITFNRVATILVMDGTPWPQQQWFTDAIVTDGTCKVCTIQQNGSDIVRGGIDTIEAPPGGGVDEWGLGPAFIFDGFFGNVRFDVATDTLTGFFSIATENLDFGNIPTFCPPSGPCPSGPGSYFFDTGVVDEWGTLTITAVPEPSTVVLLTTGLGLVLLMRRNTLRCLRHLKECGPRGRHNRHVLVCPSR
jgi:hypothetical protein